MAASLRAQAERYRKVAAQLKVERDLLRAHMVAEFESGKSQLEIAHESGLSRTAVRGLLGKRKRYPSQG